MITDGRPDADTSNGGSHRDRDERGPVMSEQAAAFIARIKSDKAFRD